MFSPCRDGEGEHIKVRFWSLHVFSPHIQAILGHQLGVLQFNLTLHTWRQCQIRLVRGPTRLYPVSPHFRCQLQVLTITCASDERVLDQRFPLLGFYYFVGAAHRTWRNTFLTRSLVYCERTKSRRKRFMGRGVKKGLRASRPSLSLTLPESPQVHQARGSLNPIIWGFYGGLIT